MQINKLEGHDERLAIASLCLQKETLVAVAPSLGDTSFSSKWANIVSKWAVFHFNEHGEPPGPAGLTAIFSNWASTADEDTAGIVGRWLGTLDPNAVPTPSYSIELIRKLVLKTSVKRLGDQITGALSNGKVEEAVALAEGWGRPQVAEALDGVFPLANPALIQSALSSTNTQPLIRFPQENVLGQFLGPTLCADALVGIFAPDKSGKSAHLSAFALRAMMQGRRVLFLSLGDMSEQQQIRRWTTSVVGRPSRSCRYYIPTSVVYKDKEPHIGFETRTATAGYDEREAVEAWTIASKGDPKRLRLVTRSAGTLGVKDIESMIRKESDATGWIPEVIVIDYAELLSRHPNAKDEIESANLNWRDMRAMSTNWHCLVLTASQTNASGYGSWVIGREQFSGSKAKLAHATSIIGISITELERSNQVCRFNFVVQREAEYMSQLPSRMVAVAGCPMIGRMHIASAWI